VASEAFALARLGHDVHVIAPGRRASVRMFHREDVPVTVWGAGGGSLFGWPGALPRATENPLRLFELVSFGRSATRLLAALAPLDRTVAHFLVPSGYPFSLHATGALEVVLHGSDVRLVLRLPAAARAHVVRSLLDRRVRFRFVSNELRSSLLRSLHVGLRRRLLEASWVELPPIDIPEALRGPAKADPGVTKTSRPRWVVCARLVASKGVDRALREAARHRAELTVIGDGPMRAKLEALADTLEPRARFVGHVPRERALALIASADKLVHLSDAEGAPTVIREARALGVAVLATAVGDVARWARDDSGIEIFRSA
jgi:teichuronic acid biosynthesis glycosyltransferase TuaC